MAQARKIPYNWCLQPQMHYACITELEQQLWETERASIGIQRHGLVEELVKSNRQMGSRKSRDKKGHAGS